MSTLGSRVVGLRGRRLACKRLSCAATALQACLTSVNSSTVTIFRGPWQRVSLREEQSWGWTRSHLVTCHARIDGFCCNFSRELMQCFVRKNCFTDTQILMHMK